MIGGVFVHFVVGGPTAVAPGVVLAVVGACVRLWAPWREGEGE
jgi:hypothetical protein